MLHQKIANKIDQGGLNDHIIALSSSGSFLEQTLPLILKSAPQSFPGWGVCYLFYLLLSVSGAHISTDPLDLHHIDSLGGGGQKERAPLGDWLGGTCV